MKSNILFLFFFALLVGSLSFVSANVVHINISTMDNYDITTTMLRPGTSYFFVDSLHGKSDDFGKYSTTYTTDEPKLKYIIVVKDETGEVKFKKTIDSRDTTEDVDEYLGVEKPVVVKEEPVVNTTVTNTTNVTSKNSSNSSGNSSLSGFSISSLSSSFKKFPSWVYYTILGVLVVGLLGFYISRNGMSRMPSFKPSSSNSNYSSISSSSGSISSGSVSALTRQIDDAEQKIKDARAQINKMKNQDKIRQMEDRLKKEREELDKLKNGDD